MTKTIYILIFNKGYLGNLHMIQPFGELPVENGKAYKVVNLAVVELGIIFHCAQRWLRGPICFLYRATEVQAVYIAGVRFVLVLTQ